MCYKITKAFLLTLSLLIINITVKAEGTNTLDRKFYKNNSLQNERLSEVLTIFKEINSSAKNTYTTKKTDLYFECDEKISELKEIRKDLEFWLNNIPDNLIIK